MNRYLLDTMTVLWSSFRPDLLPKRATEVLGNPRAALHYSIVNFWEIGLKMGRGGYNEFVLPNDWDIQLPIELKNRGIAELEIQPAHCRLIQDLPFHHKDPFDRMLIAQALVEKLDVVGSDERFDDYGITRIW